MFLEIKGIFAIRHRLALIDVMDGLTEKSRSNKVLLKFNRKKVTVKASILDAWCQPWDALHEQAKSTAFDCSNDTSNLSQFLEEPKNLNATEIKSGRSWTLSELRIKSNVDLHKLWYVLLKERNMLLTMEYNCAKACQLFASPERLDKVNESMERIVNTIQERNSAYWKLEIGEDAPIDLKTNKNELSPDDPLASVRHATELEKEKKELRKKQSDLFEKYYYLINFFLRRNEQHFLFRFFSTSINYVLNNFFFYYPVSCGFQRHLSRRKWMFLLKYFRAVLLNKTKSWYQLVDFYKVIQHTRFRSYTFIM
uniref:Large ribosomal subunit protein uL29m n=1 Tax=Moina brachiata TaxID=675436 RepID=A0A4Y7NLY5_9CRUS|nr:EOG090X0DBE [Moina brachiata]SVE93255.1 EOG090X0DBE [Moina brachiata]